MLLDQEKEERKTALRHTYSVASTVTSLRAGKLTLFVTNNTRIDVTYIRDALSGLPSSIL
jgi:hypothetical protein